MTQTPDRYFPLSAVRDDGLVEGPPLLDRASNFADLPDAVPTHSLTPFDSAWNANNENKSEARGTAAYLRRHTTARHYHYPYHW